MSRGDLLPGRGGYPAPMQSRHGVGGLHPGAAQRDQLRLRSPEEDDSANPMREPEVGAPTKRYTNRDTPALVLHHSGSLSHGVQQTAANRSDLPDQSDPGLP